MADYQRLCAVSELPPPGEAREFDVAGRMICVANVDGEISAIDNVCLHQGGPLGQGTIEEGKVVCPWHGWMFDPKTGEVGHSSSVRIPVYSIKRDGDSVYVEL